MITPHIRVTGLLGPRVRLDLPHLSDYWPIHPRDSYLGPELKFNLAVTHFDAPQLKGVPAEKVWFGLDSFQVPADSNRLCKAPTIIKLQDRDLSAGVFLKKCW